MMRLLYVRRVGVGWGVIDDATDQIIRVFVNREDAAEWARLWGGVVEPEPSSEPVF